MSIASTGLSDHEQRALAVFRKIKGASQPEAIALLRRFVVASGPEKELVVASVVASQHERAIALLRKATVAQSLGVSVWTLDRWIKEGKFPKPVFTSDYAPARFRLRDVEMWIEKRRGKRRHKLEHTGIANLTQFNKGPRRAPKRRGEAADAS